MAKLCNDYKKIPMGTSWKDFQKIAEELKIDFVYRSYTRADGVVYNIAMISDEAGIVPFIKGQGRVSEQYFFEFNEGWLRAKLQVRSEYFNLRQIADSFEIGSSIFDFQKEAERNNLKVDWIVTNWVESNSSDESKDYGACKVVPLEDDRCCFYVSGVKVGLSDYTASFSANAFSEEEINNASLIFENLERKRIT